MAARAARLDNNNNNGNHRHVCLWLVAGISSRGNPENVSVLFIGS
jgi:hypothetical protein